MDWLVDIIPYISWGIVIVVLLLPSSNSKKLKELENRIEALENELKDNK